jgi:hypothetical protein
MVSGCGNTRSMDMITSPMMMRVIPVAISCMVSWPIWVPVAPVISYAPPNGIPSAIVIGTIP